MAPRNDGFRMSRIAERYRALVFDSRFEYDPAQADLARKLDALSLKLRDYRAEPKPNAFARLMGLKPAESPRGLYVFGAVGRGKTMLMDMFFEAVEAPLKRRAHFHAFMADAHARLHQWRQALKRGETTGEDPIAPVAAELAREASLLCFDEFSVRDIADAMILGRLFTALFAAGVVVVATSNVAPDDLYKDGLNRALFLPFIALMHERLDVVELGARTDYRLEKLKRAPVYYAPIGPKADAALDAAFRALTGHDKGEPARIELLGRLLDVPQTIDGVARFDFDALCRRPLGSADYLEIAQRFHTLIVDRIPSLGPSERNEAKRFVILIDALYDMRVKLIASAAGEPVTLFSRGDRAEALEFERTASRLYEMRSFDYLALPHGRESGSQAGDLGGIVET
ncbi:MAG TPA: cell division protein ZapE [Roseiarcus sp.]|nr:cell division protein ZapE [Roseiarcus sp.]